MNNGIFTGMTRDARSGRGEFDQPPSQSAPALVEQLADRVMVLTKALEPFASVGMRIPPDGYHPTTGKWFALGPLPLVNMGNADGPTATVTYEDFRRAAAALGSPTPTVAP